VNCGGDREFRNIIGVFNWYHWDAVIGRWPVFFLYSISKKIVAETAGVESCGSKSAGRNYKKHDSVAGE
jgi:hypothetical protein